MANSFKFGRVGLLTTLGTNIGDDFIRLGLLHVVERLTHGNKFESVAVNKHEPYTSYPRWHPLRHFYEKGFRPRQRFGRLRQILERELPKFGFSRFDSCDLILQCGTPIIWDGCRDSEWAGMIWRDIFARLASQGKPILNLGGGSCYPWESQPSTLIGNKDEAFIRLMLGATTLTTVRDRLTRSLFESIGHPVSQICCPAMLTGQAFAPISKPSRKVLLNYMHGGGHYDMNQNIDAAAWEATMRTVVDALVRQGWEPLFIAHNHQELKSAEKIWPNLPRVLPKDIREYFHLTEGAALGIFNRMHASVAVAGLGIPSVAVGNDTRNLMVESLELPVFYVKEATSQRVLDSIEKIRAERTRESARLLDLREATLTAYENCLRPFIHG